MKKTKFLAPMIALNTLAVIAMPLTSCNKNQQPGWNMTEAEWKASMEYLWGETANWSFSKDSTAIWRRGDGKDPKKEATDSYTYSNWITNPEGIYTNLLYTDEAGEKDDRRMITRYAGDFSYAYKLKYGDNKYEIMDMGESPYDHLVMFLEMLYSYYDMFKLNDDDHYYYAKGTIDGLGSWDTKVLFENKKLSHVTAAFKLYIYNYDTEEPTIVETHYFDVDIHVDYTAQTIQWPQSLLDRMSRHVINFSNQIEVNYPLSKTEGEGFVLNIKPDKDGYKRLSAYDGQTKVDMFMEEDPIFKNGTYLIPDVDYTIDDENNWLEFKEPLKTTDRLSIAQTIGSWDKKYTLKLE